MRRIPLQVGMSAASAICAIVRSCPEVSEVSLIEYMEPKPAQSRSDATEWERNIIERALSTRAQLHLPFWDAVMLSCFSAHQEPSALLDSAMLHNTGRGNEKWLPRTDVLLGALSEIASAASEGKWVAITSEVRLEDGELGHIPLLDFHCPKSEANQVLAASVLRRVLPSGAVLLESGDSYHGYGFGVVSVDAFLDFLGRSLLFAPIVDRVYVAHQLIERRSALRLSAGGSAKPSPTVIWVS